ncbi:MAG TPA: prepilin-type N-terminal cleavage/methylation domain-containing protein [Candidatus Sulfotelmatobacter sp.]|jgi:type IV pilus assembly protein PilA|nr:prepilin-type N-terminal cleavage/methylation domain-containing protein [Candidatus Sulfotelmatobacter sp.]
MNLRNDKRKGFSLIELLIVVTIILIIAAIAIPNLMRSKIQANETAAVGALKALQESALLYSNSYGGFPHAISDLGPATGGTAPTSTSADLIDAVLASGIKSGYRFAYAPGAADPLGNVLSYSITATPVSVGSTGQRSFFTDPSGTIRATSNGNADVTSPPIG